MNGWLCGCLNVFRWLCVFAVVCLYLCVCLFVCACVCVCVCVCLWCSCIVLYGDVVGLRCVACVAV